MVYVTGEQFANEFIDASRTQNVLACKAIQALLTLSSRGEAIGEQNVRYVIGLVRSGKESHNVFICSQEFLGNLFSSLLDFSILLLSVQFRKYFT